MNPNLFANWVINNDSTISVDGAQATQFLMLPIALTIISFLLIGIFGYYLWKFSKQNAEVKIINKPLIITTFIVPTFAMIMGIILLVFYTSPLSIFGIDGGDALFAAYISVAIIGFLALIVSIVLMWVWLPKYAIGLTENKITFVGDYIPFSKITKLIQDKDTGNIYINYYVGKRNLKKQKFSSTSVFGQFILANANLIGKEVEQISQHEYVETFDTTENIDATMVEPIIEPVVVEEAVVEPKPTLKKPVAKKTTSSTVKKTTTTTKKPVAKKSTTTKVAKPAPVGTPVKNPKPIVMDEETKVEIKKHKIASYTDEIKK